MRLRIAVNLAGQLALAQIAQQLVRVDLVHALAGHQVRLAHLAFALGAGSYTLEVASQRRHQADRLRQVDAVLTRKARLEAPRIGRQLGDGRTQL